MSRMCSLVFIQPWIDLFENFNFNVIGSEWLSVVEIRMDPHWTPYLLTPIAGAHHNYSITQEHFDYNVRLAWKQSWKLNVAQKKLRYGRHRSYFHANIQIFFVFIYPRWRFFSYSNSSNIRLSMSCASLYLYISEVNNNTQQYKHKANVFST